MERKRRSQYLILIALLVTILAVAAWQHSTPGREWMLRRKSSQALALEAQQSPGDLPLQLALGEALERERNWADAVEAFHQAASIDPRSQVAFAGMARTFLAGGDPVAAGAAAKSALALDPHASTAARSQGLALAATGDWLAARSSFQAAVQDDPRDERAWVLLSQSCLRTRAWDLARQAAKEALQLDPHDARAFLCLGQAWVGLSDPAEAVQPLRQAVALAPSDAAAWNALGMAQADLAAPRNKELDQAAEQSLQRARALTPLAVMPSLALGALYERRGNLQSAIVAYRQVLASDPRNETALYHLGQDLGAAGRVEEARVVRRRFVEESDYQRTVTELQQRIVRLEQAHLGQSGDLRALRARLDQLRKRRL